MEIPAEEKPANKGGVIDIPRVVIAAPSSSSGKSTVTLALMGALKKRGERVQGFKCGPDYIDPGYHSAITGRRARNLDSWFVDHQLLNAVFQNGAGKNLFDEETASISVIEGVMGLFDGRDPMSDTGSTAEIALKLRAPIILVVDIKGAARSVAPLVKGFQEFSENVMIAGVIANKAGSGSHYKMVKEVVEKECQIPVLGYLPALNDFDIPERHLGLLPAMERGELDPFFGSLAEQAEKTIDIDRICHIAGAAPPVSKVKEVFYNPQKGPFRADSSETGVTGEGLFSGVVPIGSRRGPVIAIASDAAFNFYYPENLELLQTLGAKLCYFSPLNGDLVPDDATGLYLGGGFPEEFARELSLHNQLFDQINRLVDKRLPVIAECGGFIYLCEELVTTDSRVWPMAGVIPGKTVMEKKRVALGYREVFPYMQKKDARGQLEPNRADLSEDTGLHDNRLLRGCKSLKGHEYHYSRYQKPENYEQYPYATSLKGRLGASPDGYLKNNLVAGYIHYYFLSDPTAAVNWLGMIAEYANNV